ncbi:hypothetical protein [Heyndrickxia sporothermodurans]|uniref:Uncharacterized protein n=1 Tax=Heyndrickxia sporothermodurans TaxID=46224 RepID=A0AB37HMK3_9BACI|nr:hypothetical protein [Heyndrickxia sporothermodurans]MBL5768218.1 hypothetical protein [Heyndrickxia sporothermodurans]MBL5770997.1 hypothetical protein [Heyndrickxia sporothermodurans]MBL5774707.1 hypothetical protein [Heyndrickxia sporothermodurans]MBL5778099.1 hypothetical protein [Heyndrickxia sporothermodurans]MBL5785372.1 hypothetical protein [Heyndrickxia sporothermodurans]
MKTIDQLHIKNDWTDIKKRITKVAMQLESDNQYTKDMAVKELVEAIKEMDKNEPQIKFVEDAPL